MATSGIEKRIERLERQEEASKPIEIGPLRPQITREEWLGLVAAGSNFCRADIDRVIQQRATKETTE
jgi:hypothetical protein